MATTYIVNDPRGNTGPSYSQLLQEVKHAGLFETRTAYYASKIGFNALGLLCGWACFLIVGNSWLQILTAAYLALFFGRSAIIGHDTGHRQISQSRSLNRALGYLHMNLAIGMSFSWWVERHRRHHTFPNDPNRDPDIINGFISFTPDQLRERSGWRRRLGRYQGFLFVPALLFGQGFAIHINHVRELMRSDSDGRSFEICLLGTHATLYLLGCSLVLSPVKAVVFIAVNQGLFGAYLGGIIAPNHKGMEMLDRSRQSSFLIRQLYTSRNIRGGRFIELLFGGLNYQIEHHLFPSMPIPCLRSARPIVMSYCERHSLKYVETGLCDSYRQALASLFTVARVAQLPVVD